MAYLTAVTVTVGFDTSHGGRAFLGEGQSIEAFRLGTFRKSRRTTKFRLRAVLAPVTLRFNAAERERITFTCAPNAAEVDNVSPEDVEAALGRGILGSLGDAAAYKSVLLSDPGGIITISSGETPGLLPVDSDFGTPFYQREPISVDSYHRLLYREMEGGPRMQAVEELQLPSFWMPDANGRYVTFNMNQMEEERVTPLDLPVSLMKADEFMDAETARRWANRSQADLEKVLPMFRPDVIFGYASPGDFSGKKNLQMVDDIGQPGCKPLTQLVATEGPYLPSVMAATNRRARSVVMTGSHTELALV